MKSISPQESFQFFTRLRRIAFSKLSILHNLPISTLPDLLWPMRCAVCGVDAQSHLCANCRAQIKTCDTRARCPLCGREMMLPGAAGKVAEICPQCRKHKPKFDKARAASVFAGPMHDLVLLLKYHGASWLADELADMLESCARTEFADETIHAVCPVPLFHARERGRGYNQAALLASGLARRLALPYEPRLLRRISPTATQTTMDADERRTNMSGVFVAGCAPRHGNGLSAYIFGRNILLADDVMTTGSTLSECAAALKAAGAEKVFAITVAAAKMN